MKASKEVKDALKQFADRLPATHKEGTGPQTGAELLAARPDIKGPNGEAIDPAGRYFIAGKGTATNHLKRLIRAYEAHGMDAVVKYLQPYEAFLGTPDTEPAPAAPEAPRAAEGFPDGRFELGCCDCASCASIECPSAGAPADEQPRPKRRKARRIPITQAAA